MSAPTRFELLADRLVAGVAPLLAQRVSELVAERYQPPLTNAAGVARYLDVDEASVRRWAREGRIPSLRLGDGSRARRRFDLDDVKQALADGRNGSE